MAESKSTEPLTPSGVVNLPVRRKRRSAAKAVAYPEMEAKVLPWRSQAISERDSQLLEVERALVDLLERNRRGEVVGLWFVADQGDGVHQYSLEGSYNQNPAGAFAPVCRSFQGLSVIIEESGQAGQI
jgi:hypothetical protein